MEPRKPTPRERNRSSNTVFYLGLGVLFLVLLFVGMFRLGQQRKAEEQQIEAVTRDFLAALSIAVTETQQAYEAVQQEETPESVRIYCNRLNELTRHMIQSAPDYFTWRYGDGFSEPSALLRVQSLVTVLMSTELGEGLTLSRLSELLEVYSGGVFTLADFMAALGPMQERARTALEDFDKQENLDSERWWKDAVSDIYGYLPHSCLSYEICPYEA